MPNDSLTAAMKEAYASAPIDVVILHTLEFRHALFIDSSGDPAPIRVIYDNRDWTARLENDAPLNPGEFVNFIGFTFDMTLPDLDVTSTPELKITIDNVSQEIHANIAAASISSELTQVTYRPYLSSDIDGNGNLQYPQVDPPLHLNVTTIKVDTKKITATASFADMSNKSFPLDLYNTSRFPGLLR